MAVALCIPFSQDESTHYIANTPTEETSASYLLKELRHLTHQTGVGLHLALVSVREKEVSQQRCVCEGLDNTVHETRVAQIY